MRLVRILARLAVAASLVGGSLASAQLAPGYSGISDAPIEATQDEYWFFMRELGRCLAQTKRAQSVALVETARDSADEKRAFDGLISRRSNNPCARNMVSATVVRSHVRGVVAENLYKLHHAPVLAGSVPADLTAPASVRTIHDFADCYIASNYSDALNLVMNTNLGTRGETERVRELAPGFGDCLPQGVQLQIVPIDIRLAIAQALYRASAARSSSAQGAN
jgi:hypothetical protein